MHFYPVMLDNADALLYKAMEHNNNNNNKQTLAQIKHKCHKCAVLSVALRKKECF
jgi:hypothetical protein